jgi:hypothetical protein
MPMEPCGRVAECIRGPCYVESVSRSQREVSCFFSEFFFINKTQ